MSTGKGDNMNKYQEVIDYLKGGNLFGELSNEALESILELVDKATPVKPIYKQGFSTNGKNVKTPLCGKCNTSLVVDYVKLRRCRECNQVVDWSEEE